MTATTLTPLPASPPSISPANTVRAVFARAGTTLGPDARDLDRRLAAIAADAAALFRRAVEDDDTLPLELLTDVLTVTCALRELLGLAPTPVNTEAYLAGLYLG